MSSGYDHFNRLDGLYLFNFCINRLCGRSLFSSGSRCRNRRRNRRRHGCGSLFGSFCLSSCSLDSKALFFKLFELCFLGSLDVLSFSQLCGSLILLDNAQYSVEHLNRVIKILLDSAGKLAGFAALLNNMESSCKQ